MEWIIKLIKSNRYFTLKGVGHMPVRPRGTDCARVIQVIETRTLRGMGTE